MKSQAIPFIRYTGKFELNPEVSSFLESLDDDLPLAVVSIVGKYRTGKSYFVNRVLLNRAQSDGFSVGPTINPCTKGLWIWTELIPTGNPDYPTMKALIIDTEGFGGMDENVNHDTRIFLFSLLLSSYFIYNSVGSIDENALNNISLIVNLAKDIQLKQQAQESQADPAQYFPSFLWVVRDFALQMVDNSGISMASKEYLERALEQQKGLSDSVEQKNRIRRLIKHVFRDRDCITMVRPVETEKDLQRLDQMKTHELRHEFVDQIKQVQSKIFKKVKPKMIQGAILNGSKLLSLARAYIETMNGGRLPNVESAWGFVCRAEGEKAVQESSFEVERLLSSYKDKILNNQDLVMLKQSVQESSMKVFRLKAIGQDEDLKIYKEKLNDNIEKQFQQLKQNNKENLEKHYLKSAADVLITIEDKLQNDEYENYFELQNEMFKFRTQFESNSGKSKQSERYFDSLSLKIYQSAAEKLSRKTSNKLSLEKKQLEDRNFQMQQDIQSRRLDWDQEREKLYDIIQKLEREKALLVSCEVSQQEKVQKLQLEKDKLEQKCDELQQSHEKDANINTHYLEQCKQLQGYIERTKSESQSQLSGFERDNALLKQENGFLRKDAQGLQEKVSLLELDNKKYRQETASLTATNDSLQQRISQLDLGRALEIQKLQQEFDKKVQELTQDIDKKKQQVKQHNEWMVEKSYLENQVQFLKSQLDENKRLHDALLIALQQGMSAQDSENTTELVETNRNLSAAMDKIEMRCKILEEKGEKLKKFKKMVKSCSTLQCLHCQKSISQSLFYQHLNSCTATTPVGEGLNASINLYQRQSSALLNLTQLQGFISNLDLSQLQISINQTMVRETTDNKPYTEYMIKVQYGEKKWTVSRRYKSFSDLYQKLLNQFPGLKLPDSSLAIINVQDLSNMFQSKRPIVIEDRRKALQQYIRDLAKIDISIYLQSQIYFLVRNSKYYKDFLEFEQEGQQNTSNQSRSISQINSPQAEQISLHSSRDQLQLKDLNRCKQNTQPSGQIIGSSARNSAHGTETKATIVLRLPIKEMQMKDITTTCKIEKKLLPQSPQSFLRSWNEKQQSINSQSNNNIKVGDQKHRENTSRFISDHNIFVNNIQ